ncbi:LacI family DNA-binding transcriptional regulator [Paenibacillus sp.]|jgi:DNA-binding LacI/PurR family transcriptional regulator|uniref:LacI family DNA-binding transcriptional regulator n=1 Tax=Paenibacillus sp. TaxID=58172 RepID=UPI00281C3B1B|nr:LacI family DNA-binding transcriptional regulator [Paenibacillus sp.]MDR0269506.1 LacI family DNA-binding transcriptional regulator [Paenibacillus sp.]
MPNIKKIAEMAGVSISTVSRVLNNHPYVNEEKRKEILSIIEKLNYSQNSNAIHLVRGKTNVIGVLLPFVNHQYYSAIIEGISKMAAKHHYNIMLCQTGYSPEKEIEVLNMLKMKKLDGVIICSTINGWEKLEKYVKFGPIVTCEETESTSLSSVYIDHYKTFALGMEYLIKHGHTQIGYCIGRNHSINSLNRKRAYLDALSSIQGIPKEEWKFADCFTVEDGTHVVQSLLQMKERPTALLVSCNHIAAGIVRAASKSGLSIPGDLTIIGCDDQQIAEILDITTIAHSSIDVGADAFTLLHDQITKKNEEIKKVELFPKLTERLTT